MRCFQESYFKNCANPTEKWRKSCLHLFQLTAEQILGGGQIKRATTKTARRQHLILLNLALVTESESPESEIEIGSDQKFEFPLVARSSSQAAERFYLKEEELLCKCDLVFEFSTTDQVSDFRSRENPTVSYWGQ